MSRRIKTSLLDNDVTPEPQYLAYQRRRRHFLKQSTGLLGVGWLAMQSAALAVSQGPKVLDRGRSSFSTDEPINSYDEITQYNNFYEFGTDKSDPAEKSGNFKTDNWSIEVVGECNKQGTFTLDDVLAGIPVEERIYRLRCVEAWSMVVPWLGVPLASILKRYEPNSRARYVKFTTLFDPERMPGQRRDVLDWPYVEGLRIDEAMHPLSFLATGLYGKKLPNQNGAPIRLVVPWKYGFKSIKSIVRIEFVETEPATTWHERAPREYGFYANVNPEVSHPRWSQAKERRIGEFFRRDTLMFNGYKEQVEGLYSGMDLRRFF